MRLRTSSMIGMAMVVVLGTAATAAEAMGRNVVINGNSMNAGQLAVLDHAHCMRIPDGDYFLTEVSSGVYVWGYAAFPGVPQGYLGEECQARASGSGSSHSGSGAESFGGYEWYGNTAEGSQIYGGGIPDGSGGFDY